MRQSISIVSVPCLKAVHKENEKRMTSLFIFDIILQQLEETLFLFFLLQYFQTFYVHGED